MSGGRQEFSESTASQLFDQFANALTCKAILTTFHDLSTYLGLQNVPSRQFYKTIRQRLTSWRAQSLWAKLDKRAQHKDYRKQEACANTKVRCSTPKLCSL